MIETLVTIVHVLTCIFLVLVVLLQSGKGGGVSAAFGGGAGVALGQRAAATALSKATTVGAVIFLVTSMVLAWFSSPDAKDPTKAAMQEAAFDTPAPTQEGNVVVEEGKSNSAEVADAPKAEDAPKAADPTPAEAPKAEDAPKADEAPKAEDTPPTEPVNP